MKPFSRRRQYGLLALTIPLLAACAGPERIVTKEVMVPVYVKAPAPDWLMVGYRPEALPEFVSPSDPRASSALTPEGEKALRLILIDVTGRDDAWRAWAAPE
jgi:hypothetical protein